MLITHFHDCEKGVIWLCFFLLPLHQHLHMKSCNNNVKVDEHIFVSLSYNIRKFYGGYCFLWTSRSGCTQDGFDILEGWQPYQLPTVHPRIKITEKLSTRYFLDTNELRLPLSTYLFNIKYENEENQKGKENGASTEKRKKFKKIADYYYYNY